jgi:hypothetical protein
MKKLFAILLAIASCEASANPVLYSAVNFDAATGLYTYDYAVQNNGPGTISHVDILVGNSLLGTYLGIQPLVPSYTAPGGWTMYGSFSGSIANAPYNMSGGFYEWYSGGTNNIQAGTTAFGFSVTTRFAPTLDNGLNDYFLYGSEGIMAFGNIVVPGGADWMPALTAATPLPSSISLMGGILAMSMAAMWWRKRHKWTMTKQRRL